MARLKIAVIKSPHYPREVDGEFPHYLQPSVRISLCMKQSGLTLLMAMPNANSRSVAELAHWKICTSFSLHVHVLWPHL